MSCIRFNTPAQRQQLRDSAPPMLTSEEAAVQHPVPVITSSKLRRLRILADSSDPKIRESVASSRYAPVELYAALASDPDDGVRGCLARNDAAPPEILRGLAGDRSERVRGWLVVNRAAPADMVARLAADDSQAVRQLVEWRRSVGD